MNLELSQPIRITFQLRSMQAAASNASLLSALLFISMVPCALARDINWDGLNLNSQQESQINQLEDGWEKTHDEVSSQINRDTAELKQILPTGNTMRIRQLQNRITTNKMYLMNQSMETFLRKRDTLTPGQRQQLQKMMPVGNN